MTSSSNRRAGAMALVIAAVMLAALPAGPAVAAKATLTFWSWRTEDQAAYEQFIRVFQASHPDVEVRFVPYRNTEYNTILATALQAGSGPDIIQLRAYGGLEPLANAGYLMALDGRVPALEGFSKEVLGGARSIRDGRIYGVPFAVQTVQILYNQRIFDQLALREPQTWQEFLDLAGKVRNAGYIAFANGSKDGWTMETFFGAVAPNFYGGTPFYEDVVSGRTTFEDPRFLDALRKMLELKPHLPPGFEGIAYTDMQAMFAQEMAAMWMAGSYELGTMKAMNPDLRIGALLVPPERAGDPVWHTMYVDGSYGINASTAHPDEALAFVRWLATREYGQMFTDRLEQMSAVPGTVPSSPTLAKLADLMRRHGTPYLMLTAFRYDQPSGSTLLQNTLQSLFIGQMTVEQVAREIQQGLARWYAPFQGR